MKSRPIAILLLPRLLIIVIALFAGGGCQRRYQYSLVCDYELFNGQMYLLANHEQGINRASRFSDGNAIEPKRRVFCIASCSITDSNFPGSFKVESKLVLSGNALRRYESPGFLCSTRSAVFNVNNQTSEVVTFAKDALSSNKEVAGRAKLTGGHKLLLGCGESIQVLQADSLNQIAKPGVPLEITKICTQWRQTFPSELAISDDLQTAAFRYYGNEFSNLKIVQEGAIQSATNIVLPEKGLYTLHGVYGKAENAKILLHLVDSTNREFAILLDSTGKELGRCEMSGTPVADAECTTVVAVEPKMTGLREGDSLPVTVWLPAQNRKYVLSLDTTELVRELKTAR